MPIIVLSNVLQAVYADMAVSAGKKILDCFQDDTSDTTVLIKNMDMQEAMIINDTPEPQIIRIEANCIWKEKKVEVQICSGKDQTAKFHAKATIVFGERQREQQNLQQEKSATKSQIESLKGDAASGTTERFTTSMAYRMVASLAHYDASHKGVKECHLNSETYEACALVSTAEKNRLPGDFTVHPCVFDSILQLATFVLNANENAQFEQEVYVVRGWDSAFLDGILASEDEYQTYVKMTAQDKDNSVGDIAVMKNNSLFGCIKGVRVQRVPRRLMNVMFRPKADTTAAPIPSNDTTALKSGANGALSAVKTQNGPSKMDKALSIISEESGIGKSEMKDTDRFGDLGIDSLLILVIASRFREELMLDLDPSFFMEVDSIGAIKAYFNEGESPISDDASENSSSSATPGSSDASSVSDESKTPPPEKILKDQGSGEKPMPPSTSIILQGSLTPTSKTMFLFPDGSGSATSYMHLPRLGEDIAIVAMNCPYMTNPKDMRGSFEDIAHALLAEVRRRQPKGPYYVGGWSAGGAFAHFATRALLEAGEEVKSLLLIDAPCPIGLGKLPQIFFDYWRTIHEPGGIVADRPLPSWLMDHFKAVNESLRGYNAAPLPKGKSPKTYLAWAAKGTDNLAGFPYRHLLTPEESEDLGFLMDDKSDFSTRGWEKIVEGEITIENAMTSNHFTITRGEGAKLLGGLIRKAVAVV